MRLIVLHTVAHHNKMFEEFSTKCTSFLYILLMARYMGENGPIYVCRPSGSLWSFFLEKGQLKQQPKKKKSYEKIGSRVHYVIMLAWQR